MISKEIAYHLKEVRHYYFNTRVLDVCDLTIKKGFITGLFGPNGSGKSTLLKLLAFVQKPTSGTISYKGKAEIPFSPSIRSKISLLTQRPYLLKRSVFENVIYGLKIRHDTNQLDARVKKVLSEVGLKYRKFAHRAWHELSGGEAQRVAMAARLILQPEVLLLDEPVASVDTESAKLIRKAALNARNQWGTTLVVASHDLQWLYSISDHQLSIYNGNIFLTGMENIITGPFELSSSSDSRRIFTRKLSDGQVIKLTPPVTPSQTAILRKKSIYLDLDVQADLDILNQLHGIVVSMLLEKKTGHILAAIFVQDLSFVLRLIPDQIKKMQLYPGKKVIIKFQSSDVEWM